MEFDELMKIMKNSKKLVFLDVANLSDFVFTLNRDEGA